MAAWQDADRMADDSVCGGTIADRLVEAPNDAIMIDAHYEADDLGAVPVGMRPLWMAPSCPRRTVTYRP